MKIAEQFRCPNTIHSEHVEDHRCHLQKNHQGECSFGNRRDPQHDRDVAHKTVRWIAIKTQFEERYDPTKGPTMADVDHSSLLQRLLEGKEPLPVPPPKQFSYPAYHLVEEEGPQRVMDVWFSPDGEEVVIEQSRWKIDQENTPGEDYVVSWEYGHRYRLYKKDNVKIGFGWKHGEGMDRKPRDIFGESWVLERIPVTLATMDRKDYGK